MTSAVTQYLTNSGSRVCHVSALAVSSRAHSWGDTSLLFRETALVNGDSSVVHGEVSNGALSLGWSDHSGHVSVVSAIAGRSVLSDGGISNGDIDCQVVTSTVLEISALTR